MNVCGVNKKADGGEPSGSELKSAVVIFITAYESIVIFLIMTHNVLLYNKMPY